MRKVLVLLISKKDFLLFLVLELFSFTLILLNNPYQGSSYFSSSNALAGNLTSFSHNFREYLNLYEVNAQLARENSSLKSLIIKRNVALDSYLYSNSNQISRFEFLPAKVVNSSVNNFHNYITINIGSNDGIKQGMGVVSSHGVVGKVKTCSKNFATVSSLLHRDMLVSAKLVKTNTIGTVQWEGDNPMYANLKFIPRHIKVVKGDMIEASEFNSVFPSGQKIGQVYSVSANGDDSFYNIKIKLLTDFYSLGYVYVIKSNFSAEQDSLETLNISINDKK